MTDETTPNPPAPSNPQGSSTRAARTAEQRRNRLLVGGGVAVAVAIIVAGFALLGGGGSNKVAQATPVASTVSTLPGTTATTAPPKAVIATTKVPQLSVYEAPDGQKVVTTFSALTEYKQPRTLLVTDQQGDWLKTLLPMRPNDSVGWIKKADVTLSDTPYEIRVSTADHTVTLYNAGQQVLTAPVAVGTDRTPTPLGTFYVTDPVDLRTRSGGAYGTFALGLSGYSEVLLSFNGGPGQIALHGTNQPELIGQNVSNGCIRVDNDTIVKIATTVPLGTPVIIT
jgi:lipoprotein-anchoring transpeptidase ErfK/SrfK